MSRRLEIIVVGAGIFGVTCALELCRRGNRVRLLDPGPLPHPDAASTDISKAVRMDYGADVFYTDLAERAIHGWQAWNRRFDVPLDDQPQPLAREAPTPRVEEESALIPILQITHTRCLDIALESIHGARIDRHDPLLRPFPEASDRG